jgi:hypothetical protein
MGVDMDAAYRQRDEMPNMGREKLWKDRIVGLSAHTFARTPQKTRQTDLKLLYVRRGIRLYLKSKTSSCGCQSVE